MSISATVLELSRKSGRGQILHPPPPPPAGRGLTKWTSTWLRFGTDFIWLFSIETSRHCTLIGRAAESNWESVRIKSFGRSRRQSQSQSRSRSRSRQSISDSDFRVAVDVVASSYIHKFSLFVGKPSYAPFVVTAYVHCLGSYY